MFAIETAYFIQELLLLGFLSVDQIFIFRIIEQSCENLCRREAKFLSILLYNSS